MRCTIRIAVILRHRDPVSGTTSWREPDDSSSRFAFRCLGACAGLFVFFFGTIDPAGIDARAHVIMGTKSLHLRVVEAKLIVVGRVLDPDSRFVSSDGQTQRQLIEIEILETLKGTLSTPKLRFAQDGHEVARYQQGDEAIFFLAPIADSRELRALAVPGGPGYVSGQEHNERFLTTGTSGKVLLTATRDFVSSGGAATAGKRVALIRRATLDLLTSGDAQLANSALANLVITPQAALITKHDLPRLEALLSDTTKSIGLRAGLIAELDRRGLIDGPAHWLALLKNAPPSDLPPAIRASGPRASEVVRAFLRELLTSPDTAPEVAAEAAIALGASRDPNAIDALSVALSRKSPRLRFAAIRALGQIGSENAKRELERAAATHPDPATQRRAIAELRSVTARNRRSAGTTTRHLE
jgi:hypothetical protein